MPRASPHLTSHSSDQCCTTAHAWLSMVKKNRAWLLRMLIANRVAKLNVCSAGQPPAPSYPMLGNPCCLIHVVSFGERMLLAIDHSAVKWAEQRT
eukprot:366134-Chlamydomonas_euryale.AAC.4